VLFVEKEKALEAASGYWQGLGFCVHFTVKRGLPLGWIRPAFGKMFVPFSPSSTNATLSCSYIEKIGFSGGDQAQVFHRDPPHRDSNTSSLPVGAEWGYAEGEDHAGAEVKTSEGNLATSVINKPLMRA